MNLEITNIRILFIYSYALLMLIATFIFVEKIRRFVITEFVKLSDEFDRYQVSVMRVGSDTFGDPIFQKGLQN